jgi:hypothetical protein
MAYAQQGLYAQPKRCSAFLRFSRGRHWRSVPGILASVFLMYRGVPNGARGDLEQEVACKG